MSEIRFSPQTWRRGGQAYRDAGTDLVSGVARHLSALDVNALGCNQGQHLVDAALALVVPAVKEAFEAACADLADSMTGVGNAMIGTGDTYQALEDAQADLASQITKEL
ncbi:MAG: hypothetical protein Q4G45_00175 [Actinomycetia bacterium]|nr:hypothetical protein [Actinomycetes bacterium]